MGLPLRTRLAHLVLALALATGLAPDLQAQNVSLKSRGDATQADVSINWTIVEDAIAGGLADPVMANRCGTTAAVTETGIRPPGGSSANTGSDSGVVAVTLALARWQCFYVEELVCKGFSCNPVQRESRTKLFDQSLDLRFALAPGVTPGQQLTISAAPALDPAEQRALLARVPDYRRIDVALRDRISEALAPTARAIQLRLPAPAPEADLQILENKPPTARGLNFSIQQHGAPRQ